MDDENKVPIPGARTIDGYLNPLQEEQGLELLEDGDDILLVRWRRTDEGRGPTLPITLGRQPKSAGSRERLIRGLLASVK